MLRAEISLPPILERKDLTEGWACCSEGERGHSERDEKIGASERECGVEKMRSMLKEGGFHGKEGR